jgi:hypothetical protein
MADHGSTASGSATLAILFWLLLFAFCGGVSVDGQRYDVSCGCSPMGIEVERE